MEGAEEGWEDQVWRVSGGVGWEQAAVSKH